MAAACIAPMYHYVRDAERTDFPAIRALRVAEFEAQLDWLQDGFEIATYSIFLAWLKGEYEAKKPLAILTFDDGLSDHYEQVFPILHARGISGLFFLCGKALDGQLLNVHAIHFLLAKLGGERFSGVLTDALIARGVPLPQESNIGEGIVYRYDSGVDARLKRVLNYELSYAVADEVLSALFRKHIGDPQTFSAGLYLTEAMIGEMAAGGMTFGYHTKSHRIVSRLSPQVQQEELGEGVSRIRGLTGQETVPFSFPYGHRQTYNDDTIAILRQIGYSVAFSTFRGPIEAKTSALYELPRYDTKDLPPFTIFNLSHA